MQYTQQYSGTTINKIKTIAEQKTFNISKTPLVTKEIVTSGGVLIYKFSEKGMELLLVNSRGGFEDFGGKIDSDDQNIYKTVAREAFEESNQLLNKKQIESRLKIAPYIYIPQSKYVVFIIEANFEEEKLKQEQFGETEIHDNIERKVKWVTLGDLLQPSVIKHKLNWRLKSSKLFAKLHEINNNKKLSVSMFK